MWIETLSLFVLTLGLLIFLYVRHCYGYWEKRKVPFLKPKFPIGNMNRILPKGISIGTISYDFYHAFKNKGTYIAGGIYIGLDPAILIIDPGCVKDMLITNFDHFVDRGIYMTDKVPITVNIFAQNGADWRNMRTKFSPLFSSAKLKMFFNIMKDCCLQSYPVLDKAAEENSDVHILEVMACYTTDVIGNIVYGIECNSFKQPDADFRKMGRQLFEEFTLKDQINLFLSNYYPKISQKIGISNIQEEVDVFFTKIVRDAVECRKKQNVQRTDLLQLLIDMKNSEDITMDELIAQAFLFFAAGYETSSTTLSFAFYELGSSQDIQDKVREEIQTILKKHNYEITYDAIMEMKYLQQVVEETLRKWPPLATLPRVCVSDYNIPDTNIVIEKGTKVLFPALALHRDPAYWPDPMTYDPDRFAGDEKRWPYFPFGDGPRNCVGARYGLIQVKIAIVTVLKHYRVFVSPNTTEPLELDPDTFVLHTTKPVLIRVKKISESVEIH